MNTKEKKIVITSAVRTAIGTFNGSLKDKQGHELGSIVAKEALNETYSLIEKPWAPVAQLDRALGYGPGGSGFNS